MHLLAVLTAEARPFPAKSGWTGIFKTPREGAVRIGPEGLDGDAIVDRANHGGPEQAVYVMGSRDLAYWAEALGRDVPPGLFGENLTVDGLDSARVAIGDVLAIGAVRLQVTAPRIPCVTLSTRMGSPGFARRFVQGGHPGAYARVLAPGEVAAGDPVDVEPWEGERVTVAEVLRATASGWRDEAMIGRLVGLPAHEGIRRMVEARAQIRSSSAEPTE